MFHRTMIYLKNKTKRYIATQVAQQHELKLSITVSMCVAMKMLK